MVVFPNAKINLGLQIKGKRTDGFHEISSLFLPVNLTDALEIIESSNISEKCSVEISGLLIDSPKHENLCCKAYTLLDDEFDLPPVNMYLHKVIPMGAGLGGGSSDGAFALLLLNELFSLNLTKEVLKEKSSILGSDCSFFVENKPALVTGRGENVKVINFPSLVKYTIVIVHPNIHVSTADAYKNLKFPHSKNNLMDGLDKEISEWSNLFQNDFETYVFKKYPKVKLIKEKMNELGAVYTSMTGSGSAIFGIFEKQLSASFEFPDMYTWEGKLKTT